MHIYDKCVFGSGQMVLEADASGTSITINEHCTFGDDLMIEAGQGNKVVIGRDCMADRAVRMSSCQKISIYEMSSGVESKTLVTDSHDIVIGEHTAIGSGCHIGKGAEIGSGSIISDNTTVNSHFSNNCLIAGTPAAVIRTDVCWSRKAGGSIADCPPKYRHKTGSYPLGSCGKNILIITDGKPIGIVLAEALQKLGHTITLCGINDSFDVFGTAVKHLTIKKISVSSKVFFDGVYDTAMLSPEQWQTILPSVKCNKYILLSSTLVYAEDGLSPVKEEAFDPMHYQSVYGENTLRKFYRYRETTAFKYAAENGMDILAVRVPRVVNEREIYLTAIKAAQRAIQPGSLYHIDTPVVFVRHLAAFLAFAVNSEPTGAVNFSDKGILSEALLHQTLYKMAKGSIDLSETDSFSDEVFSHILPDLGKAEKTGFSVQKTEEWLLPMIEYYAQPMLPYDVKYRLPLLP